MDKNAIKKYAVWARNELIARVSQKAQQYGITTEGYGDKNADSVNGVLLSATEKKQRQALIAKIDAEGFEQVMEEVAYTWFNRFTALRFMEVNNYLPSHTRVFTNEANEFKPQILADAISLELEGLDMDKVFEFKNANKDEELYKYLLIVQCNALSSILPGMFQKIADYTELLLPDYLLREGSAIEQMIVSIPENDWTDQVQIIGWLYQFYNSEKKEKVFAALKNNIKITKENIPAATQLFTPDWIVRYMVENSLGRLWQEAQPNEELKNNWKYYLKEAKQNTEVDSLLGAKKNANLSPEEIRVIDPCMGSGHILVYAFEVLMQIYESTGYTQRDAAKCILEKNIYGLDIDDRAGQLAYFAVMMMARKYNRRILNGEVKTNVMAMRDSSSITDDIIEYVANGEASIRDDLRVIKKALLEAKEYGSILDVPNIDYKRIYSRLDEISNEGGQSNLFANLAISEVYPFVKQAEIMAQKYDAVITNPPYMGRRKSMTDKMTAYLDLHYPNGKMDLFSAFILKGLSWIKKSGYVGMMTPYVWLYLNSYVDMRKHILNTSYLQSVVQLEKAAFSDAAVSICAFVVGGEKLDYKGTGVNLENFPGEDNQPIKVREAAVTDNCDYVHYTNMETYRLIPDNRFVFWITDGMIEAFNNPVFESVVAVKQGITTSDNERFLRLWHEVQFDKIGLGYDAASAKVSDKKWFPYSKGGENRRWYGNNEYVINYENDGEEIKAFHEILNKTHPGGRLKNREFYFRKSITWSDICGTNFAVRSNNQGFLFDVKGSCAFASDEIYDYIMAFMNTKVVVRFCNMFNPSVTTQVGDIKQIPLIIDNDSLHEISELAQRCIEISKAEWDSHEKSWDFEKNVLRLYEGTVEERIALYLSYLNSQLELLCKYEERINEIFIRIYGMESELDASVSKDTVTINIPTEKDLVLELISYAVGCLFGRYSVDYDGVKCTDKNIDLTQYHTYIPDKDNIVPICGDEYFGDDIVNRFIEFIKNVFGSDKIEENLKYISKQLGGKGTSREIIRNYFLSGFYSDHCRYYQKRPIYWMFDSGKKNGFKCLIYAHRYQEDTIARIRTDYVHELQSRYRTAIDNIEQRISVSDSGEKIKLNKQLKDLLEQSSEIKEFEERIHHLADQMITLRLDDGIKANYDVLSDVLAKIK